jgi:ADP-glucose pyrophosphorylase
MPFSPVIKLACIILDNFHVSGIYCVAIAGANSTVRKCIVDKNARIGNNVQIINKEGVKEANRENEGWVIKDSITIIIKDSTIADGTVI